MRDLFAKAAVNPVRQRTQYSCMSASAAMAFNALGYTTTEDEVNKVMGAAPMQGAAWEQALATAQHYGCRATLTCPSTVGQLKEWTDRGIPVMIAWNPEGREWSHASLVFDVVEDPEQGTLVYVADPNIPDPDERVRIVPKKDFYAKWYEKWPRYMVRRPAMAIEREITADGRQVMASSKKEVPSVARVVAAFVKSGKDITLKLEKSYGRSEYGPEFVTQIMRHPGNGAHQTRTKDVDKGRSRKEKHKKDYRGMEASIARVAEVALRNEVRSKFGSSAMTITGAERAQYLDDVWSMYEKTYRTIGMHISSPAGLLKYDRWDIGLNDGIPVSFALFEQTPFGWKSGLSGSDGSSEGRSLTIAGLRTKFKMPGIYGEVSHKVKDIVLAAGAPIVCAINAEDVLGKHVQPQDDGVAYSRSLSGFGVVTKVMVGLPRGVPTTSASSPSCPISHSMHTAGYETEDSDLFSLNSHLASLTEE